MLGKMLDKSRSEGTMLPYLRNANVRWHSFDLSDVLTMPFAENEVERYSIKFGDLIVCEGGEPGRCAIWNGKETIMYQKALHRLRPYSGVVTEYIELYLSYLCKSGIIEKYFTGSGIKHLTGESLSKIELPLPPTSTQKAIVSAYQILSQTIDKLNLNSDTLQNTLIYSRSKILDLAMQGKLVPQDPSDESAADMLRRVNPKAEIITDNPHYPQLPDNWVLTNIESINTYKSSSINPSSMPNEEFDLYSVPIFSENHPEVLTGAEIGSSKQKVAMGDVLLCKINPHLNRVWEITESSKKSQIASSEWIVIRSEVTTPSYLRLFLSAPSFREMLCSQVSGVGGSLTRAQPAVVKKYPITLPPIEEQQRIVNKINILLSTLDEIAKSLTD